MNLSSFLKCVAASSALLALTACETSMSEPSAEAGSPSEPAPGWAAFYSSPDVAGGKVFTLDPASSSIRIYAFRGGKAPKLGHNHVLAAPSFTGYLFVPAAGPSAARFDLELRLDQLELDRAEYRANLGEAFAAKLSAEDIAATREHMLGDQGLQASQYPLLHIRSLGVAGETPKLAVTVRVDLHGRQCDYRVPLDVDGLPSHVSIAGSFVVRQSDFGIVPYSALGGLLAVQDELVIEFRLLGA